MSSSSSATYVGWNSSPKSVASSWGSSATYVAPAAAYSPSSLYAQPPGTPQYSPLSSASQRSIQGGLSPYLSSFIFAIRKEVTPGANPVFKQPLDIPNLPATTTPEPAIFIRLSDELAFPIQASNRRYVTMLDIFLGILQYLRSPLPMAQVCQMSKRNAVERYNRRSSIEPSARAQGVLVFDYFEPSTIISGLVATQDPHTFNAILNSA